MSTYNKEFIYKRGSLTEVDLDFDGAKAYMRVKLGQSYIFWKKGLKWNAIAIKDVERAFRRVEEVKTKVCCGPANFDIERLILVLKNQETLDIRIGDGTKREAEELYANLKEQHPELQYGKK